jgi:hypothetical protein
MNTTTASDRGDRSGSISAKQDHQRQRLESKIAFIESRIDSLPGFLPDSYQYLMQQLDQHQHQLLKILLQDEFDSIDSTESTASEH